MKYQGTHMGERHVFDLIDLDEESRDFAVAELEAEIAAGTDYKSPDYANMASPAFLETCALR